MKNKSHLEKIFSSLIIIFILILVYFLIPFTEPNNHIKSALLPLMAILGLVFFIQGFRLTSAARKEKGKLKLFLMLTGISAIALFPFALLHNLFYGLAITFENFKYLFEVLQVTFFIMAVVISPITFIVGVVSSIICFKAKQMKKKL